MPTKKRTIQADLKKAYLDQLDHATKNAPNHVFGRLHKASELEKSLRNSKFFKWRGLTFDERGQPIKPKSVDAVKESNRNRHNEKLKIVKALFSTYQDIWSRRGTAKLIAFETNCHADTVRRYIREFPKGI